MDGRGRGADGKVEKERKEAEAGGRRDRRAAAAAGGTGAASRSESGLLRRMLEDAHSRLDRIKDAFARYRGAAGAKIAELSFAVSFAQAENEVLAGLLAAARGRAEAEEARADELDGDNREKQRHIDYVDNPDTPSRSRSVAYDQRRVLLQALSPFYGDGGEVVDEAAGREGGRKKRPRGGQPGHAGASNCDPTEGTFAAYDLQRCPRGHPLIAETGRFGKRVWDTLGAWVFDVAAANGGAARLRQEAMGLAAAWGRSGSAAAGAAGPTGRAVCIWLTGKKYECDVCGLEFWSGRPVSIPGTAAGRMTRGRAYEVSAEISDAKTARSVALFGGPSMGPGFVRNMRMVMKDSDEIVRIDDMAKEGIAAADCHERDEVAMCGDAGREEEEAEGKKEEAEGKKEEAEGKKEEAGAKGRGARKSRRDSSPSSPRPRRKYVYGLIAATKKWVRVYMSPTRSRADILLAYEAYSGKPFGSDQYSGQEKSSLKHYDCLHIDRRAASCAGAGYEHLLRAGMIDGPTLYEFLRIADGWVRKMMDLVRSADADGAEAARAIMAVPLPPPPPATVLPPRSGGKGGKGAGKLVQLSEERAMQYRMDLLCYLAITRLIHALKKIDTLPEPAIEALKHVVRSIVGMYGEGHRVKKSILGALPHMFGSLRVPGMPMHTADVENTIRWLFSPFRESRKQVRSIKGMRAAAKQLTFVGVCRKHGISPSEAYQRLLDDPKWDITKHPQPPPPARRRRR